MVVARLDSLPPKRWRMLNSIHCPQLQIEMLQKRPHVLGATPGRLLDLVDDGMLTLGLVRGGWIMQFSLSDAYFTSCRAWISRL